MREALLRAACACAVWAAITVAGCEKKAEVSPVPAPPPPAPTVAMDAQSGLAPDAGGDTAPGAGEAQKPTPAAGAWVEAADYKLKLEGLRECGRAGELARFGAVIRIQAKAGEVPISPRDATLESGGIIFRGQLPSAPPVAGCTPALPARLLKKDEAVVGHVVFELPVAFKPAPGSLRLIYRPTRWGGAGRVSVGLPDCLARCSGAEATDKPEKTGKPKKKGARR